MKTDLDLQTLGTRFRDYGMMAHTQVTSLMFSGIFALAAFVLLDMLRTPDQRALRLSFWLVAITAEISTLNHQMLRPVLLGSSGMDSIPLLALRGVIAMFAFALLSPQYAGADGWHFVYLVLIPLVGIGSLLSRISPNLSANNELPDGVAEAMNRVLEHRRMLIRFFPDFGRSLSALDRKHTPVTSCERGHINTGRRVQLADVWGDLPCIIERAAGLADPRTARKGSPESHA